MPQLKGQDRYDYIIEHEQAGMAQKDIAKKLGLTHSNLRNWLTRNKAKFALTTSTNTSDPRYYPNTTVQDPNVYAECIKLLKEIWQITRDLFNDDLWYLENNKPLPEFLEAIEWRVELCKMYNIPFYCNTEPIALETLETYWSKHFIVCPSDETLLKTYLEQIPSLRNIT